MTIIDELNPCRCLKLGGGFRLLKIFDNMSLHPKFERAGQRTMQSEGRPRERAIAPHRVAFSFRRRLGSHLWRADGGVVVSWSKFCSRHPEAGGQTRVLRVTYIWVVLTVTFCHGPLVAFRLPIIHRANQRIGYAEIFYAVPTSAKKEGIPFFQPPVVSSNTLRSLGY